ncbi:uncharacterized protein B0I36DRAFT_314341 [Microdochium trichocladiopsis]|uniref:Uncharacterized protein n=1 Tax=Microdochium trichocladiopsis TaxID=1682393 RepID=A0A9P8YGL2_9PEZI|nr:uncharacterized protein B0I36DRAFT_314341 [Microdochium trichocladiopsis]KAH7037568.1 hypothetical protein B0I36DRAFT_314341 [Microdochium trichocladiopsis]
MAFSHVEYVAATLAERATKTWTDSEGNVWQYDTATYALAWWIVVLIIWISWFCVVYAVAFIVYFIKERRRKRQGLQFRTGHVFWKAFCIASGLWFWIWVFKKCGAGGADSRNAGGNKSMLDGNNYNQLEGGGAWYGANPQHQLHHPQLQQQQPGRFEPIGYAGSGGIYQHPYQQHPQQSSAPARPYDAPPPRRHSFSAELH